MEALLTLSPLLLPSAKDAKKNKTKYSSQEVTKLLGEMQTDLERVLSHSGRHSGGLSGSLGRLSIDDANWENNNNQSRREVHNRSI